jgi:hypothetical protein
VDRLWVDLIRIQVVERPWQACEKVEAEAAHGRHVLCSNNGDVVAIGLRDIQRAGKELKGYLDLVQAGAQKLRKNSGFSAMLHNIAQVELAKPSHHKKDIYEDVKVQRRKNIALFLIEFPHEYLHWRNYGSVQQQQTADKKLYCRRQNKPLSTAPQAHCKRREKQRTEDSGKQRETEDSGGDGT